MRKTVRVPTRCQVISPPCALAACCATARPSPIPSGLPVTNGSNSRPSHVRRRTRAGVAHLHGCGRIIGSERDSHSTPSPDRVQRVADDVAEQISELAGVAVETHVTRGPLPVQLDSRMFAARAVKFDDLRQYGGQRARFSLTFRRAAEIDEPTQVRFHHCELAKRDSNRLLVAIRMTRRDRPAWPASPQSHCCEVDGQDRWRAARSGAIVRFARLPGAVELTDPSFR